MAPTGKNHKKDMRGASKSRDIFFFFLLRYSTRKGCNLYGIDMVFFRNAGLNRYCYGIFKQMWWPFRFISAFLNNAVLNVFTQNHSNFKRPLPTERGRSFCHGQEKKISVERLSTPTVNPGSRGSETPTFLTPLPKARCLECNWVMEVKASRHDNCFSFFFFCVYITGDHSTL